VEGVALQSPVGLSASLTPIPLEALESVVATMAVDAPDLPGITA